MKRPVLTILLILIGLAAIAQNPFRTRQTGDWNDPNTWEEDTGGGFAVTLNTPSNASGAIAILSGHTVTVTANVAIDQTTVQSGGILTLNSLITLTISSNASGLTISSGAIFNNNGIVSYAGIGTKIVSVSGIVNNTGTFPGSNASRLLFNAGSIYNHQFADGGTVPTAAWNATSTVNIVGYTTGNSASPLNLAQTFGNFTWNAPNQDVFVSLAAVPINVLGNLSFLDTADDGVYFSYSGAGFNLSISGSLIVGTDGVVGLSFGDAGPSTLSVSNISVLGNGYLELAFDQNMTINCSGDFSIAGGIVDFTGGGGGVTTMNLGGNFTQTGGSILSQNGTSTINFTGNTPQTVTSALVTSGVVNYTISSSSTVSIPGNNFISGNGTLNVSGVLQAGSTATSGAIQTGTSAGNLRLSGARTYNNGSTIVYNGSPAFIGSGHPTTSGVNTEIVSSGASIVGSRTIGGNLILTSGNLTVGSNTLTLNGTITPNANSLIVASTSSISIGGSGAFGSLALTGSTSINNFSLNRNSSGSVALANDLTILGTFTHTSGVLSVGANILTISGDYGPASSDDISTTASSTVIINNSGMLPNDIGFVGGALGTLTISRSGNVPTTSSFTVTNLNLVSGTFANGSGIAIATGGTITRSAGGGMNLSPNNTTNTYNVVYTSGTFQTGNELPGNTTALANLSKTGSGTLSLGSSITINGTLNLSNGTFDGSSNAIDLKGNFVSDAASILQFAPVTFSGNTTITGNTAPFFGSITITGILTPSANILIDGNILNNGTLNAGSATTSFVGNTTISGSGVSSFNNLTITSFRTLTAPSGNFNVAGVWTNDGTFNKGSDSNTVTFNGTNSITGTSTTDFGGLIISGSLTAPAVLNVGGHFTNDGTFTAGTGTLTLNGSTAQSLQGATNTIFNNISSSNPSTVTVQTDQSLTGALTLSAGIFNANGRLTLISNASGDARIAQITGGATITGSVIAQRYLPNAASARAYRFLTSPVTNALVSDWKAEFPITGTFNDPSTQAEWPGIAGVNQSSPSLFLYNEAHTPTATIEDRYESFPPNGSASTGTALVSGTGYAAYVRQTAPIVLDLTGTPQQGNVPVNVTAQSGGGNDGWNLIGNPYASPINWNNVTIPGGVGAQITFKDNTNNIGLGAGAYVYFTQGGAGIPASYTGTIASGQGFWVRATSAATITFQEDDKQPVSAPAFIREGTLPNIVRIHIYGNSKHDEMVVHFTEDGNDAGDAKYDAFKLKNDFINISSLSTDGKKLAINGMGKLSCFKQVPVVVEGVTPGAYNFNFTQLESFDAQMSVRLLDSFTGNSFTVTPESDVYNFSVTSDSTSFGRSRFTLIFGETVSSITAKSGSTCNAGVVALSATGAADGSYRWYETATGGTPIQGATSSIFTTPVLTSTKTYYVAAANSAGCEELRIPVVATINVAASTVTAKGDSVCNTGSVTLNATGAVEGSYRWYENATSNNAIAGATSGTYHTPVLTSSKIYYVSATNADGCEEVRKPVAAVVTILSQVTITEDGKALKSSYAEGNQWYFNGHVITGATGQSIEPKETGLYKLTVTSAGGCTSSTERQYTVATVTAVEDEGVPASISIYPNPTTDVVNVSVHSSEPVSARLVTVLGVTVNEQQLQGTDSKKGSFNLRDQSEGVYLLIVQDGSHVYKTRIIKKR